MGGFVYFENVFLLSGLNGWVDIMNGFNFLFFQIIFEGNIEIRGINFDKDIGFEFGKMVGQIGVDM